MSITNISSSTSSYTNSLMDVEDSTSFEEKTRTSSPMRRRSYRKHAHHRENVSRNNLPNSFNQMIVDCATPVNTDSDENALKRSSSPLRRSPEEIRPLKQIKFDSIIDPSDEIMTITNQCLAKQFKRSDILGRCLSDQSSMVCAVEVLGKEETRVLKITDAFPPLEILSKIKAIWEQGESIHLTETILLGKIQVCSGSYLSVEHSGKDFVAPPRKTQKRERWAYVYSMPLKAGDLKALKENLSVTEEAAIEVVRLATESFLNVKGIEPFDMKDINILTRPLSREDYFQGKRILDYDYLRYTIGSEKYYLPVGKHLITLCDYDQWKPSHIKLDFTGHLEDRLKRAPHLLAEIEQFKIVPRKNCKVLFMN